MKSLLLCLLLLSSAWASPPAGQSLYQLRSAWIDSNGSRVLLPELKGKVRLLAMVYTSCQYSCPIAVEQIKKILAKLKPSVREAVAVSLFSFDSEAETPATLKSFAKQKGLDPMTWTLFKSDESSVRELAVAIGVGFKRSGKSDYAHTNLLLLLDRDGNPIESLSGLGGDPTGFISQLTALVEHKKTP